MLFCGLSDVIRYGHRGRKQLYKCKSCGRQFIGSYRRDLSGMRYVHMISKDKDVTVQMDTAYRGRNFGLMVIKDVVRDNILWHKYVHHETMARYVEGVEWLRENGFRIYVAVIYGMNGSSLHGQQE